MGVLLKKTMSESDAGKAGISGKSRGKFTMCMYVCKLIMSQLMNACRSSRLSRLTISNADYVSYANSYIGHLSFAKIRALNSNAVYGAPSPRASPGFGAIPLLCEVLSPLKQSTKISMIKLRTAIERYTAPQPNHTRTNPA